LAKWLCDVYRGEREKKIIRSGGGRRCDWWSGLIYEKRAWVLVWTTKRERERDKASLELTSVFQKKIKVTFSKKKTFKIQRN